MRDLEDRARVVAHPAHEPRVEGDDVAADELVHSLADRRELAHRGRIDALGQELADRGLTELQELHGGRPAEERLERVDRSGGEATVAKLGDDAVVPDLVEL